MLQSEPTEAQRKCIGELALRFPCGVAQDVEAYLRRLELLAHDTSSLATPLLRKACDRAAQRSRFLPFAADILQAAAEIVEERQAQQHRDFPDAQRQQRANTTREDNLRLMMANAPMRWIDVEGKWSLVSVGGPGSAHRCNGDGKVSGMIFREGKVEWEKAA